MRHYRRLEFALLLSSFGFDDMPNRHDGVVKDHSRTCKAHDLSDPFSHTRLVAMDFAARAEGLCLHKWTVVNPLLCVGLQRGAFGAKRFAATLIAAVKSNHQADNFLLPLSFAVYVHLRFSHKSEVPAAGY